MPVQTRAEPSSHRLQARCTRVSAEGFEAVRLSAEPESVHLPDLTRVVDLIDPKLRTAVNALVTGRRPWPLFLHGPAGTGKTRAMLCLCDRVPAGLYSTVAELCERRIGAMRGELWYSGPNGARVWEGDIWRAWSAAPLVVLDELATRDDVSGFQFECGPGGN